MDSTLITLISVSNVALVTGSRKSQLKEETNCPHEFSKATPWRELRGTQKPLP
jgi:hypothetical protein